MKSLLYVALVTLGVIVLVFVFHSPEKSPVSVNAQMDSKAQIAQSIIPKNSDPIRTSLIPPPSEDRKVKFQKDLEKIIEELPKNSALDAYSDEELHHGPAKEISEAADLLGHVKDNILSDSSLISEALAFYKTCAMRRDLLSTVRALCLRNFQDWSRKIHAEMAMGAVEPHIQRIADELPAE